MAWREELGKVGSALAGSTLWDTGGTVINKAFEDADGSRFRKPWH
jgi:hypothetical protein